MLQLLNVNPVVAFICTVIAAMICVALGAVITAGVKQLWSRWRHGK